MGGKRNNRAFEIALSGVSCAVAAGALALGILSGYLVATGYIIAVTAIMVPLSKQYIRGATLAYIGTCILAVALGAAVQFWDLVPFALFFGLHPIVNVLQIKYRVNRWLALAIKAVWFDGMLIAAYFLIYVLGGLSFPPQIEQYLTGWRLYAVIFTVGSVVLFAYDYLLFKGQIALNALVRRIIKN